MTQGLLSKPVSEMTPEEARAEAAMIRESLRRRRQEVARVKLLGFMEWCWQTPNDPLIFGRHTKETAAVLDRALRRLQKKQSTFLRITWPFRSGKSDMVSRNLIPFALGLNPDWEIILGTYGAELSEELSGDALSIMRSDEYKALFPRSELNPDKSSRSSWAIRRRRGKVNAVGVGGAITGKGAHILIIDDPLKNREEAENEGVRQKRWDGFINDMMTRLAPHALVIVMSTRWHVDDLHGRIENKNNPRHKDYDPKFPKFDVIHYRAFDGPVPTQENILFPERYSLEWYERQMAQLGRYGTASLLQGDPIILGGNLLAVDKVRAVKAEDFPEGIMWVRFWDLASTERERAKNDPDYTVGAKVGYGEELGMPQMYVADVRWCQEEAIKRNRLILSTAEMDGPACWIGVESVAGYKDTYTTVAGLLAGKAVVHKVTVSRDKVVRAQEMEPIFAAGGVRMLEAGWTNDVLKQLGEFPAGTHDDIVDAIAGGFALAKRRFVEMRRFGGQFGRGARL